MTAKQRAARAKFKAVVAEAKKLRKKNPKLTQAQAVKQAFAISYSKAGKKKVGAVKKKAAPKKKAATKVKAKKSRSTEMHTDTKSHNVNIRVISGLPRPKKFIKIPAKDKTWFRKYVYGFYGKKGVQAASLLNNGFTRKELNARLNLFFKIQHDKGVNSWNKGDSVDRERFRDMFLMDQVKKSQYIY